MTWTKVDVIHHLVETHGYRRYLELCTPTTGGRYASLARSKFDVCHRLMYRCPADYDDGMPVDFRSDGLSIEGCVKELRQRKLCYDIMLVDPWHEYETSYRDLKEAFALLERGGTIVVHDCLPRIDRMADPNFVDGEWCGVTYKAYLDFVTARRNFEYYTVDTDYGCGIICKVAHSAFVPRLRGALKLLSRSALREDHGVRGADDLPIRNWGKIGNDFRVAFAFLQQHKDALLHLMSVDEFVQHIEKRGRTTSTW